MTGRIRTMTEKRNIVNMGFIMMFILMTALVFGGVRVDAAKRKISKNTAKAIAAKHAGFKKSNVRFAKAKYDREDNEYDIEFVHGNYKYDYDISARNGKVKGRDIEKINCVSGTNPHFISTEKAKRIVLKKSRFKASKVIFTKIKMGKKHGKIVYEIEFVKGKKEYEYKINAKTGKVVSVDVDRI